MDRHRGGGGERYNNSSTGDSHHYRHHSRGSTRPFDGPESNHHRDQRRRTPPYRAGAGGGGFPRGGRDQRAFDSPPHHHPPPPPRHAPPPRHLHDGVGEGGMFPPMGGGGFGSNYDMGPPPPSQFHHHARPPPPPVPLTGQKRGYPFSPKDRSPDRSAGGSFAKLFVGSVPRTAVEEDIRPLFEEHGHVLEVALIKDKRTGQQQGCCFIKYATSEEADRAIRALHNQYILPGGTGPIQVRYADGERERLGAVEYKLFVGSLNKQATEKEVEEIFAPYGRVEDVYLMRDEMKHSRGCGFVKYAQRDMALAAINALNGIYTMRGCDQPLTVRFADPKKPRVGESRGAPAFGGPGFSPRLPAQGIRTPPGPGEPLHDHIPPNAWRPMSPQSMGPPTNASMHGFGNQLPPRTADMTLSSTPAGPPGGFTGERDGPASGIAVSAAYVSQPQNFNPSLPQVPPTSQQISPLQKPLQSPQHFQSSFQLQPPNAVAFAHTPSYASVRQPGQMQPPYSTSQIPFSHMLPSQQLLGVSGQLSDSQPQMQQKQSVPSATGPPPFSNNLQSQVPSVMANQPQPHSQQQLPQPPSQLAQMLSQQTQTLQASFQSSQQAFSQLQQQLQLMQPSNQNLTMQQGSHTAKQQPPWTGVPQSSVSTPAVQPGADKPFTSSAPSVATITQGVVAVKCNWSEHTSPDGYKYYYNSTTGESKWEKPEELLSFEQQQKQQQKPPVQQPQVQSHPQDPTSQPQIVQNQVQAQLQTPIRPPQQLQQTPQSLSYAGTIGHQRPQELGYPQLQSSAGSINDMTRFQQGFQAAQDWMWKNKPTGT